MNSQRLRSIPSVEKVLQSLPEVALPRAVVVQQVRRYLAGLRQQRAIPDFTTINTRLLETLEALQRSRIQPVINGTGIIIHTNLGRAPLADNAIAALEAAAAGYTNLEFDLTSGERGARAAYLEAGLAQLCQAPAALVANNCAAALVLILRHFVRPPRNEVIISRGELVQIGGGFRIPQILEVSGAVLREVGTTNKTSLPDYARAVSRKTALLLKVHRSNFFMSGFVESPSTAELSGLSRKRRIPLVEDLGSGAAIDTERLASIEHEPTPAEILRSGVDLVCFSGDKLFGGPQAGVIAGKAALVAALKREPLYRALRCDKLILTALQATVDLYLDGKPEENVPALKMLRLSVAELEARAAAVVAALSSLPLGARPGKGRSQLGGGALPQSILPSVTLDLQPATMSVTALAERLRMGRPPLVGTISGGVFKIDLRTVLPSQDESVIQALRQALTAPG